MAVNHVTSVNLESFASASGLDAIFAPASVAVVGASNRPGSVGRAVFKNILDGNFAGIIYPVNPKTKSVCGVRAYSSLSEIADQVDMAVIIVPAAATLEVAREAAGKGVKGLVVISAGFKETGDAGKALEEELRAICLAHKMRLIGPNCLGLINTDQDIRLNASFARQKAQPGNIAFISQSGALCTAVLDFAAKKNIGFSKFISVGNKADIGELALIRYLHEDPNTKVIMLYVEDLRHGAEFIETVREITGGARPTPILAVKSGRTAEGAAAVSSHTGSLAGSEAVYNALFEQSGVYRVQTVEELFDFALAFATQPLPRSNRIAIITNAGGPGIIATDVTIHAGLQLAELNEATREVLASHLPKAANIHNPIDVIGDARSDRYQVALAAVLNDENVDGVIFILTPQSMTEIEETAAIIPALALRSGKPVVASFMGLLDVSKGVEILEQNGIPHYPFPEGAARAMGALYHYSQWLRRQHLREFELQVDRKRAAAIIKQALDGGLLYLGEVEGNEILEAYGFPVLPSRLATTPEEAAAAVAEFGPCAMKIVSPQVVHKSDVGGVRVGVATGVEAAAAFGAIVDSVRHKIPQAVIQGVFVQQMAAKGVEVILGIKRYPSFGPLIMFGLGGIFVEIFKDVSFRLAPIRRNGARHMIRSIKAFPMLNGARGAAISDQAELERCLLRLSMLATDHPAIAELDINPLIVHEDGQGCSVADCRILLK
ncbi:MAG: acetate--CoA ligase family protein [Desulfobulbaceae bacterium]|nr:acetate--CoA ligase family protein [Desulfobulbaceae bacterium]HIJ79298.1 CoA-binding protein [Deltaproteobacteria bacterium]